jgi:hypothetical protein
MGTLCDVEAVEDAERGRARGGGRAVSEGDVDLEEPSRLANRIM